MNDFSYLNPKPMFDWANEREYIRMLKEDDLLEPPWTHDPILSTFRFCNVYREEDRVTRWIKRNVREPFLTNPNLWFMLVIARVINWPDTIEDFIRTNGWPVMGYSDQCSAILSEVMEGRKSHGEKVYTGAYMVRAESNTRQPWYSFPKSRYLTDVVFRKVWDNLENLQRTSHESIETFSSGLTDCYGIGPFIAYQTAVDLTWCRGWLDSAPDLETYAKIGPGTRRGLNRLAGREVTAAPSEKQLLAEATYIHSIQADYLAPHMRSIRLSDITNCLCETDKYLRVKNGEGSPRSKYVFGRGY